MIKRVKTILLVLLLLTCVSCSREIPKEEPFVEEKSEEIVTEPVITDPIRERIANMSLDEKVGMLFIIRPDALDLNFTIEDLGNNKIQGSLSMSEEMIAQYNKYPPLGFALFTKNITDEKQLRDFTKQIHSLDNDPLICIDEEGGLVSRIANSKIDVEKFPNMEEIAMSGDTYRAYQVGETIGRYLDDFGIDVDFAPVADVNTNPKNPIIGVRAFGSDPVLAGDMVAEVIKGLRYSHTLSCIKHFPGHGDTTTDSHLGYASTDKSWEEMLNVEMVPFIKGIENKTDMVMVAHITTTNIDSDNPASLSYELVTNRLRNELNFDGVVITDSMSMGAITNDYDSRDAAIKAIKAGVDIILLPENYYEAFDGIKEAINSGEIGMDRIDESIYRILKLKEHNNQ